MKPLVLVTAPVGTRSGYGSHSRDICRSLIAMDKFDVKIWPVRWGATPQNALDEGDPNDTPIIERMLDDIRLIRIHCPVRECKAACKFCLSIKNCGFVNRRLNRHLLIMSNIFQRD